MDIIGKLQEELGIRRGQAEAAVKLIDEGNSPVMIHDRNDRRFLMFAWTDFMNRFGWLYTQEEIAAIEAACREYEETTNDLLYK